MGTSTSPLPVEHRSDALTVMRRMFDEGFATGGTAVVDELCAADLVEHQFGMAGVGADAIQHVKDAIRDVHAATPDMSFTIEDSVEHGDTIWVRVRATRDRHRPLLRAAERTAGRHHRGRHRPHRRRPHRRALGRARPVRPPGPDRHPQPARLSLSGAAGG